MVVGMTFTRNVLSSTRATVIITVRPASRGINSTNTVAVLLSGLARNRKAREKCWERQRAESHPGRLRNPLSRSYTFVGLAYNQRLTLARRVRKLADDKQAKKPRKDARPRRADFRHLAIPFRGTLPTGLIERHSPAYRGRPWARGCVRELGDGA